MGTMADTTSFAIEDDEKVHKWKYPNSFAVSKRSCPCNRMQYFVNSIRYKFRAPFVQKKGGCNHASGTSEKIF